MSDDPPSDSESTRSASETRQDIADFVIEHTDELSDAPGVKEFVEEHGRLTKAIAEARERQKRLAKAKQEYEPLEQRVDKCRRALSDAETGITKLHRPLGETAFNAFLASDINGQSIFADRLAIHKRVQELQQECDGLTPDSDAGLAQQAKAKAQRMAIKGKIKLEQLKFSGLHTKIGRKIVEGELDESILCKTTVQLLSQIENQRDGIASFSAEFKEATKVLTECGKKLAETIGLDKGCSSKNLDAATKLCAKNARQHESELETATRGLADALQEVDASALPNPLVPLLGILANAREHDFAGRAEEYRRKGMVVVALAKQYWNGLDNRMRIAVSIGIGGIVLLVVLFFPTGVAAKSFSYKLIDDPPSGQPRIRSIRSVGSAIQASLLRQHYKTVSWQAVIANSTREAFKGHVVVTFRGKGDTVIVTDRVFVQLASLETSRVSNELRILDYEADHIIDASCEVVTDQ